MPVRDLEDRRNAFRCPAKPRSLAFDAGTRRVHHHELGERDPDHRGEIRHRVRISMLAALESDRDVSQETDVVRESAFEILLETEYRRHREAAREPPAAQSIGEDRERLPLPGRGVEIEERDRAARRKRSSSPTLRRAPCVLDPRSPRRAPPERKRSSASRLQRRFRSSSMYRAPASSASTFPMKRESRHAR